MPNAEIEKRIAALDEGESIELRMADDSHVRATKRAGDELVAEDGEALNLDEVKGVSSPVSSADPE